MLGQAYLRLFPSDQSPALHSRIHLPSLPLLDSSQARNMQLQCSARPQRPAALRRPCSSSAFVGSSLPRTHLRASTRQPARQVVRMGLFGLGLPELAVIAGVAALIFGEERGGCWREEHGLCRALSTRRGARPPARPPRTERATLQGPSPLAAPQGLASCRSWARGWARR